MQRTPRSVIALSVHILVLGCSDRDPDRTPVRRRSVRSAQATPSSASANVPVYVRIPMMSSGKSAPASGENVWWNGLRWVEAAHMQVARLAEAFFEEVDALTDASMRHGLNDDSDLSKSWRVSTDANQPPYDPRRPLRILSRGLILGYGAWVASGRVVLQP